MSFIAKEDKKKKEEEIAEGFGAFWAQVEEEYGDRYGVKPSVKSSAKPRRFQILFQSLKGKGSSFLGSIGSLAIYIIKLLILMLITINAFYPSVIQGYFWTLLIILIVIIAITLILGIFFPQTFAMVSAIGGNPVISIILPILLLLILLAFIIAFPSPGYEKIIGLHYGSLPFYLFFLSCIVISFLISLTSSTIKLLIFGVIYAAMLYAIIPYILVTTSDICLETNPIYKIPYISDIFSKYVCKESGLQKISFIQQGKIIPIPSAAGIEVEIGFDKLNILPAGHKYQETIFLTNYYKDPEDENRTISILSMTPYIYDSYYKISFIPTDYSQKKRSLKPGETYGEVITFNPESLDVSGGKCLFTKEQNPNLECAYNSVCSSSSYKSACVQTGHLECKCINWLNATCREDNLYIVLNLTHDGFIIGNGTLYYYEKRGVSSEPPRYEYRQGPAKISFSFNPNPWVREIYEGYIDEIQMFANLQINGYSPTITNMIVKPIVTNVTIYDYLNNKTITETIGVGVKECVSKDEINENLKPAGRWSSLLCTLTPPEVKTEIRDMKTGEIIYNDSVSIALINQYCNATYLNFSETTLEKALENATFNKTLYEKYFKYLQELKALPKDLRETIDQYGLCSILKQKEQYENETIQQKVKTIEEALREINIYVRMDYEITETFSSSRIPIYNTSACK